ncbi:hypothetical protein PINS_up005800 [Pythium insidiosum]|nr:hypothetical protein PINS_up005800 [Pythium insidiosum]
MENASLLSDVSALERFLDDSAMTPWELSTAVSPIDALFAHDPSLFQDLEPPLALPPPPSSSSSCASLSVTSPSPSSTQSVASSEEIDVDGQRDDLLMSMLADSDCEQDHVISGSNEEDGGEEGTRRPGKTRKTAASRSTASSSKKLSSRQRQREEILVLRESVKQMEEELRRLRHGRNRFSTVETSKRDASVTSLTTAVNAFWEGIAKRESVARSKAMEENLRLQQQLRRHYKLTKALQKVLQQRLMLEHEDRALSQARFVHLLGLDDVESSRIYCSLLSDLDLKYVQTDDVLVQSGLAGTTKCYATKVQGLTYREEDADWCLEAAESRVIPFDEHRVKDVTWKHFSTSVDDSMGVYQVDYHDHNMIKARFCVAAKVGHSHYEIKGYLVSRRYVENDRSVFVWSVWNIVSGSTSAGDESLLADGEPLELLEDGWSIVSAVPDTEYCITQDCSRFRAVKKPFSGHKPQTLQRVDAFRLGELLGAFNEQYIAEWMERWERMLITES